MTSICANIAQSKTFQRLILVTILIAGITVGIQTYKDFANRYESILTSLDTLVLIIFTLEVLIKITAEGKHPQRYFNNAWNIFDFVIVAVCFLPFDTEYAAVLRLLRLLRVLKLVRALPRLQVLVATLLKSIPIELMDQEYMIMSNRILDRPGDMGDNPPSRLQGYNC